jgi:hypothetical protein
MVDKAIELPNLQGAILTEIGEHALPHRHGGSIRLQLSRMAPRNNAAHVEKVESV